MTHHHLFHHSSGLTIQVAQFTILWLYLGGVDLRMVLQDVLPPGHSVDLLQMDQNSALVLCRFSTRSNLDSWLSGVGRLPIVQVLSSTLISLHNSPSMMESFPFRPTIRVVLAILTSRSLPLVPFGTSSVTSSSPNSCLHLYGSAKRPS